jgi:hypothetical protein
VGQGTGPAQGPVTPSLAGYASTPLGFSQNLGQSDPSVRFISATAGFAAFLTDTGAVYSFARPEQNGQQPDGGPVRDVVSMTLAGANGQAQGMEVFGTGLLPQRTNYFTGSDPSGWYTDVPNYAGVTFANVYPGVDLLYGSPSPQQRTFEFSFSVQPGADPGVIRLSFAGAGTPSLDQNGNLLLHTGGGDVLLGAPSLYQAGATGARQAVTGGYVLTGDGTVGLSVGDYDTSRALVIDPSLSFSTYLGGSGDDKAYAIAVDGDGNSYVL